MFSLGLPLRDLSQKNNPRPVSHLLQEVSPNFTGSVGRSITILRTFVLPCTMADAHFILPPSFPQKSPHPITSQDMCHSNSPGNFAYFREGMAAISSEKPLGAKDAGALSNPFLQRNKAGNRSSVSHGMTEDQLALLESIRQERRPERRSTRARG